MAYTPLSQGFFLWICMIVSRCCKSDLYIEQGFYFCKKCNYDCDTIFLRLENKDDSYEPGDSSETQEFIGAA
jgi:hypothetical protein